MGSVPLRATINLNCPPVWIGCSQLYLYFPLYWDLSVFAFLISFLQTCRYNCWKYTMLFRYCEFMGPRLFGLYPNGLFTFGLSPFGLPMTFGLCWNTRTCGLRRFVYRGQHLLSCPAAFCNLHGTCRIFQSAWLFTSKLQGRCCHFHRNFTKCPYFSVKQQQRQNVSAQPFLSRKTKN